MKACLYCTGVAVQHTLHYNCNVQFNHYTAFNTSSTKVHLSTHSREYDFYYTSYTAGVKFSSVLYKALYYMMYSSTIWIGVSSLLRAQTRISISLIVGEDSRFKNQGGLLSEQQVLDGPQPMPSHKGSSG